MIWIIVIVIAATIFFAGIIIVIAQMTVNKNETDIYGHAGFCRAVSGKPDRCGT